MNLKGDFINKAYSRLRISGLTVNPSPEDNQIALSRLENMASRWHNKNICTGYAFETEPDVNAPHNVPRKYWDAYETSLAIELAPDFGKQLPQGLVSSQRAAYSDMLASTSKVDRIPYPARQPRGRGNRTSFRRYYGATDQAPNECKTNEMYQDDINDYAEDFSAYLVSVEDVASYTIEADTGLTIASDSLTSPVISYQIQADTVSDLLRVKIVILTTLGRRKTRIINFKVLDSEL